MGGGGGAPEKRARYYHNTGRLGLRARSVGEQWYVSFIAICGNLDNRASLRKVKKVRKELPLDNCCAIKTAPGLIFVGRSGRGAA